MPYTDKIVDFLNDRLKRTTLSRKAFQKGIFYGLAKQVLRTEQGGEHDTVPVIFSNGMDVNVSADDTYPFQIYHRALSSNYGTVTGGSFGDGVNPIAERTSMVAVVYGDPDRLSINDNDLAFLVSMGLNGELSRNDLGDLQISKAQATVQSVNYNSQNVYQGEYLTNQYPLHPQSIFFSVNYTIDVVSDKDCLSCTDCPGGDVLPEVVPCPNLFPDNLLDSEDGWSLEYQYTINGGNLICEGDGVNSVAQYSGTLPDMEIGQCYRLVYHITTNDDFILYLWIPTTNDNEAHFIDNISAGSYEVSHDFVYSGGIQNPIIFVNAYPNESSFQISYIQLFPCEC